MEFVQELLAGFVIVSIVVGIGYLINKFISIIDLLGCILLIATAMVIFWVVGSFTLIITGIHPFPEHWNGCFMGC